MIPRSAARPLLPLLAIVVAACAHQPPAVQMPGPNRALEVAQGEQLTITLDANPTTGFQWQLAAPLDEKVITLVGNEHQRAGTAGIGAGGTDVWTFKAVGTGSATIVLEYRRPWEKDVPAAERKRFAVVVR
jgi:inhibitor of cysteine peptidase